MQNAPSPQSPDPSNNTTLLALGLCSLVFWPLTAIPGIIVGRRHPPTTTSGKVGYAFCKICLFLFTLHLLLMAALLLLGGPEDD